MKKLLSLALAILMCAALFTSCGKFDMENADLSAYIKLGDISEFTYEEMVAEYEAYRVSQSASSSYLTTGYTIDFLIKAEIVDESGNVLSTVDKWTHNTEDDYVAGYDVYRYAEQFIFDYALVYKVDDVNTSTNTPRLVKNGEEFSFTMTLSEDYEDADLAGKTVKFTVNVKKSLPAVYNDSYIAERLQSFYNSVSTTKETIEYGDTITIDFTGTVDGEAFDGGTAENYILVVGEAGFIDGFEDQLVGHKHKEKFDITVTFPEDYELDPTLAGKEAVFSIKVEDIYNDTALITENTPFADMWELKYALRVESYIAFGLMDVVRDRSELIEYPEKLLSDFEKIYKSYVERDIAESVVEAAENGESYSKSEMREILYPDGSDKTYIETAAKEAAFAYMVVTAVQRELGLSYTDKAYEIDLALLAEDYASYYGDDIYTSEYMEEFYGEEVLRLSFLDALVTDELVDRVVGAPEIPGK